MCKGLLILLPLRFKLRGETGADKSPLERYAAAPHFPLMNGGEAMRRLSVLAHLLLGSAFLTTGCMKLDFFKRAEGPRVAAMGPRVGAPAPDLEGEDVDGKRFKLSDYRGKVVVVSFWASWCKPCRDLIPHEQSLVQHYADKPFVLLGVNIDDNREAALKVITTHGISWRNWRAGGEGNPIQKRWPVEVLPTIYVIDANGIIRHTGISGAHLESAVESLLTEAQAKRYAR
jgi:thiol-disulfide isomerase/thioredoxin